MSEVSYVPGDRTAIVGERCWLLVDAPPDGAAIAEIWQQSGRPPTPDTLLAGLLRVGFGRLPDFALLAVAADGRPHLICRGGASATVVTAAAPARIDGAGLLTWREHPIPDRTEQVFLGEPPAGLALRLPAAAGVLLASCVAVDLTVTGPPGQVTHDGTVTLTHPANGPSSDRPASPGGPGDTVEPQNPHGALDPGRWSGQQDLAPGQAGDMDYDYLWGATQMRTVEDAAVRPAGDDPGSAFPFHGPAATSSPERQPWQPLSGPPAARTVNVAAAQPAPGGLIDAVPWAVPSAPAGPAPPAPSAVLAATPARPAAQPGPGPSAAGDGFTIPRGQLPRAAERELAPDRIGPTVRALLCPCGHVNPPSSAACRRCAAPLPQDPVIVPRPVLGVLRLSAGDEIALDRDVVMGRSPRADFAGTDGEERPHVVKLPSTDGDISRTHLRVSLDGWHVLVTDLNSTNGTLVTMPGRDPEQLRPGEPTPIQPGTVVTLADGIEFRYEVTE